MKRLLIGLTLVFSTLLLSGCDELFKQDEVHIWFDEPQQELHISFDLKEPSADSDTGEVPDETIHLYIMNTETGKWEEVYEFNSYRVDDEVIPYNYNMYGDVFFKVYIQDAVGEIRFESPEFTIYVNEPQFIYHFDTWFDSWSGQVQFNFGINEFNTSNLVIEKSSDGGLNWEQIIESEIILDEQGFIKNQLEYYEFEEGNYVYRLSAYDELGDLVDQMNSWEIKVYFENRNYEGNPEIWYVGANYEPYSKSVHIWWDSAGLFDGFIVEKSFDLETWTQIAELPRIAHTFNYQEDLDGEYHYRVSAVGTDGVLISLVTDSTVRVKQDAVLGGFNGYVEWDSNNIQLDWQFYNESVDVVVLERKTENGDYELLGEFGGLKMMYVDEFVSPGTYQYRVSVLDTDGTVLDQLESKLLTVQEPEHVYHINGWHNSSTGEVEINFGFNQYFVTNYVIEKSNDGGLTWEEFVRADVEYTEYDWYKDHIKVYEFEEGTYTYRITGYDELGNRMGTSTTYHEVVVQYGHLNFDDPVSLYYLDGNFNVYDQSISLWWDGQGTFETHLIEYSLDQVTWTTYQELPRVSTSINIKDLPDGEYFFRVSALSVDGVITSIETGTAIRLRQNAQIGNFYGYYDWNGQVTLYWDIVKDNVTMIRIERRLVTDDTYSTQFDFGPFKTTFIDDVVPGEYVYRITLLDESNQVIDQMESNIITVTIE